VDENVESTVVVLLILKNMGLGEGGKRGKKWKWESIWEWGKRRDKWNGRIWE